MRLVGVRVYSRHLGVRGEPAVIAEYHLDDEGAAVLVLGHDTWLAEILAERGVVISGFALPPAECLARHYGIRVERRRRYFPRDGAAFLVGVLAEVTGAEAIEEEG